MIDIILNSLKGLAFGWFIANFEPLQHYIQILTGKIKWSSNPFINYFKNGLSCFKCLSFWSTIIICQLNCFNILNTFYMATLSAFIAYLIDKIVNQFKNNF